MSSERLARAEAIFLVAVKLSLADRPQYLDQECLNNIELRKCVDRLLNLDEKGMTGFLVPPQETINETFSHSRIAGSWVDRFQLVRKIGQGGMGQVFLAQQQEPKRDVALKILRSDLASASHTRHFKIEIEVLGRLNHPGIAQIHDAGTTEDGNPYFAMEYVPGVPLTDFLKLKKLNSTAMLELAIQICDAVHYAHEKGIIHRDLKPANILVVDHGEGHYQTKILDFGVAHLARDLNPNDSLDTLPGQLLGTLAYMSPEQASCNANIIKPSSDVYQLGVILFEMLAGKLPLYVDTESIPEALRKIIEDDPPSLVANDDSLNGDIQIIVAKAMAKEPDRRYTIAGELALDLRRYLNHEPIEARPTTAFYLLRKKLQRRRGFVTALLVVALISVSAGWFFFKGSPFPNTKSASLTLLTPTVPIKDGYHSPAISPDGSQLAVTDGAGNFKLLSISGKDVQTIVPGVGDEQQTISVCWHPAGQKILLTRYIKDVGYEQLWHNLATAEQTILLTSDEALLPVISPDGNSALVRSNGYRDLGIMDLTTGEIKPLSQTDDNRQFHTPVWGPDGKRIAFIEATQNTAYHLQCMDLEGNKTLLLIDMLLESYSTQSSLLWLPDGRLLYALDRQLSGVDVDLWAQAMKPNSCQPDGDPQRVFSLPTWLIRHLSYSAQTNRLAFYSRKTSRNVSLFELNPNGSLKMLDLPPSGWPGRPKSFVNDGRHLVIRETRGSNDTDVLLQDIITGEIKPLLCGPGDDHPISMSADGKYLFLFRGDKNLEHAELWAHCLADSKTVYLDYTLAVEDYYKWISSPVNGNGMSYLFSQLGTDIVMRKISATTGVGPEILRLPIPVEQSPNQNLLAIDMSPDASQIAYLINYEEVHIYNMTSEKTVTIKPDMGYLQKLQWSVDGQWLYVKGIVNPGAAYWIGRIDVATQYSEILWGSETQWPNEFFMSQDGKYLSCQIVEMGAALGMLEGL